MYRVVATLGVLIAALLIANGLPGQDKKDDKQPDPTIRGVLPPNWGKLELSTEQKQKIYKIEAETKQKVYDLQKQIDELKGKEKQDMLGVLTAEQKKKLKEILEEKSK